MPNKAVSKAQFRFFQAAAHGKAKDAHGMSPETAKEMLGHQSPKGLPERKGKKYKKAVKGER